MTEHGHEVIRNTKTYDYMFDGKNKIYIPDFRVDGKLVEIKGYNSRQVKAKIESVKDEDIKILYYKDLSDMMDYVDKKYGTKHTPYSNNYFILYDEDKPEISDFEYDMLMLELRNLEKEFPEFIAKDSLTRKSWRNSKRRF